ncbi:nSTAND1 domain-containing NTPase [Microtetraspora malaysiensis]|uniref:Novel STAND NTPase 1 domain-containing protein n=1 Tax=Microtetraspora malaysiensis TaxID=161358 RepID=A0ABW6T0N9_9ACTN
MGRRERPVDPADGPVAAFAVELRKLRQEAGSPSYRAMAAQVHFSSATLAAAAAGDKLATLPVTLAYVEACGGDRQEWQARWEEVCASALETAASGAAVQAPYRGLARFETADQAYFFGRGALVERLATLVGAHRFVMVVGPSGSGKSSLLRAGLVPALQPRTVSVATPAAHLEQPHPGGAEVVVVDQFEETFTLCQDPAARQAFINALMTLGQDEDGTRVVLAVRADFFGHCAHHPELIEAVRDSTILVGPMSPAELREAIVKPAAEAGLIVQRELTARLVEEVTGQPGGLPLMSHALLETWRRRHGKALTMQAYEAAGGIDGAVAHTAEEMYAALTVAEQQRLRHLLLRMITPGEAGNQDTRRPVARAELVTGQRGDSGPLLLERLAAARLITLDDDTADLAHEALMTAWPRLRDWVEEDRERLRVHRRLTEAATAWQDHARDPGTLYRGLQLATAREHLTEHLDALTPEERAFLEAGTAAHHRARRRRRLRALFLSVVVTLALVAASLAWQQNMAGSRQQREVHARRISGTAESLRQSDPRLAMQLSLAAWRLADLPETRAALLTASRQAQQDTFTDPDPAPATMRWLSTDGRSLISVSASQITRWDLDTRRAVSAAPGPAGRLPDAALGMGDARWLPLLHRRPKNTNVTLWDMTTGHHDPSPLDTANQGVEVSHSGGHVIVYHADGSRYRVRVWDLATRAKILQVSTSRKKSGPNRGGTVRGVATARMRGREDIETDAPDATISANGKVMALCVPGAPIQLWNLDDGHRITASWAPTLSARQCREERLFLAPDGQRLLLAEDGRVRLWHLPDGKEAAALAARDVYEVGFSRDGSFLATAGTDELLVWRLSQTDDPLFRHPLGGERAFDLRIDPATDRIRYLAGALTGSISSTMTTVRTLQLNAVADSGWQDEIANYATFSPDGHRLAITYDNRVELRDGTSGQRLPGPPPLPCPATTPGMPGCLAIAAFRRDGRVLAYSDVLQAPPFRAWLWDLDGRRVSATSPPLPQGKGLAFAGDSLLIGGMPVAGDDASTFSTTSVWDPVKGRISATVPVISGRLAVDPTERLLVSSQGHIADLAAGVPIRREGRVGVASALAFSPYGRFLAAGKGSGQTALWDGKVRSHLGTLTSTTSAAAVTALAFSPDARMLAVGMTNGTIQLWDTETRQPMGAPITTPGSMVLAMVLRGNALYVAGGHIPYQRFDLTPAAAATTICNRAGEGLTPENWAIYFPGYPYQPTCGDNGPPLGSVR